MFGQSYHVPEISQVRRDTLRVSCAELTEKELQARQACGQFWPPQEQSLQAGIGVAYLLSEEFYQLALLGCSWMQVQLAELACRRRCQTVLRPSTPFLFLHFFQPPPILD